MGLILAVGSYSAHIDFIDNDAVLWYFWQLPEHTTAGFVTAWLGYTLHQLGSWWLIFLAKKQRPKYRHGLHPINLYALMFNALFVLLHIVQTKIWYDGTAQSVSVLISQFSVIFLLVVVLIMENPRRGMFFGKKVPIKQQVVRFLRKYHGYYFSWAIIFTFWYHPIELTGGHLLGTFYIFLLMMQGSLFFTHFHRNRFWTTTLEVYVLFHGAVVAYLSPIQSMSTVAMFVFGFFAVFVVTQIHGLGVSRRVIVGTVVFYLCCVIGYYWPNLAEANAVIRVPMIEYGFALLVVVLVWLGLFITQRGTTQ
ncbi:MAG: hypothetical protein WD005_02945 [Haliea sp.]